MPMRFTTTAGGTGYADIRVGEGHGIHQVLLDVSAWTDHIDADGMLPPGLGVAADGTPAHEAETTAVCVVGPEPVHVVSAASADVFGNAIYSGVLNGDMIADNTGAALGATLPAAIVLI